MIPIFIMEEHNEAFYIWNYAISNKIMPAVGNTLFHVDQHDDMSPERFNISIHDLQTLAEIKGFADRELRIANFILPSAYMRIFDSIYWIKFRQHSKSNKPERRYVRSYNNEGLKIISGKMNDLPSATQSGDTHRCFDYYLIEAEQIENQLNVVLDIDLDYFSSIDFPTEEAPLEVEITENEFKNYNANSYHKLNFLGPKIETKVINGRFYFLINNYNEIYPSRNEVDFSEIDHRIESLLLTLSNKNVTPTLIDICRSRHSGYTPNKQWRYIEEKLLEGIKNIYPDSNFVDEFNLKSFETIDF